jgi:hypothetical protein
MDYVIIDENTRNIKKITNEEEKRFHKSNS